MSLARAVGRNTIIQFVGKIVGTILGFATSVLILRYLHPEGNGAYTTAMAYLGFCSVVADLGLYLIVVRDLNKPGADPEYVMGNLLALRWTSALTILGIGALLVSRWGFTPQEQLAVIIGTGSFVAVAGTQLFVGFYQSKLAMLTISAGELVGRVVLLVATWWVTTRAGSLNAIMWSVVAGSVANFLFVWWSISRVLRIRLRFDWPYWWSTLRDTLPIAVSIVLNLIYFRADTIILRLSEGAYDVGLYGAAYKILEILNNFPLIFVGLLLPTLGAAFARGDQATFVRVFQRGFELILMAIVPLLVGGWLLAEPALILIGRAEYAPAAPVLRILLFAVGALYLGALSGHVVTMINQQRKMVWSYLAVAAVGLVLYLTLIPRFSMFGAAFGTVVTESLTAIVGYVLILRVMRFRLRLSLLPRVLLAGVVMGAVIMATRSSSFWLAMGTGIVAYGAMLFVTRVVTRGDIRELVSREPSTVPTFPE